ncbi:acyl carrier protein [Streptomyces sp. NPDC005423]|uniref:acyl carrier protein n=1 Tax=Streptomyces sp. NPDC005423 TaxID=3155343 RepID=UPI00339FC439
MAPAPWNATFETVLRQGLPGLTWEKSPAPDAPMESYGLDSLALIGVISTLESTFSVTLAGQVTIPVHSITASQLWGIVSTTLQPAGDEPASHPSAAGSRTPAPGTVA